jgi:starch phosphorylase
MSFQIQPFREFLVRPALPPALPRLSELAYNLLWSWEHNIRGLFRRLDPVQWRASGHNPVLMLARLPQVALGRAAADPRFIALYRRACERLDNYRQQSQTPGTHKLIAYFSMEYGMVECLTIYSGGLGVLSGDHMKGASDADLPLVGVGLLYQKGYLQQTLNPDGWQTEKNPDNDFYTLPISPVLMEDGSELKVSVKTPSALVWIKVWYVQVGRIKLYLMDTNIPENVNPEDRNITDQLYGGDSHMRIRQELVLGIGGLRALKAMGLDPTVFHMNEGHSAFLAIERIRVLIQEQQLSFEEALYASRNNNVFTTHTSVPAGIDLFEPGLMYEYFQDYCTTNQIPIDKLLGLGRRNAQDSGERFSMAILAIKTSSWRNAVSMLHRHVSQDMWSDLWPQLPVWEVPITSVTNGTHLLSWLNGDLATLYDQYLQPDWRERYTEPNAWDLITDIPDQELWEAHRRRRRQLIVYVRTRVTESASQRKASGAEMRRLADVLDPEAFTIGFGRRFATYKRATLLFRDVPRLKRLLTNPRMPVQIVIAGKAHPKDHPGKQFIREIVQLSRDPELAKRLVFVEDYGIGVAREMVQGVDLWLNTPRRGEEACGTSGMKAGLNGILNLSILDGWFDEAYEYSGGWAIGDRSAYAEDQDDMHASAIYSLLENEIVPVFYEGRGEDVPHEWIRRMKQSLRYLSPQFNSQRMISEYMSQLYEPAHSAFQDVSRDSFAAARQHQEWDRVVQAKWDQVAFVGADGAPDGPITTGSSLALRASVELAGLAADDVRVEAMVGRVGVSGQLEETEVIILKPVESHGTVHVFAQEYVPHLTGRLGYALRVSSNHYKDPLTRPTSALMKWR